MLKSRLGKKLLAALMPLLPVLREMRRNHRADRRWREYWRNRAYKWETRSRVARKFDEFMKSMVGSMQLTCQKTGRTYHTNFFEGGCTIENFYHCFAGDGEPRIIKNF